MREKATEIEKKANNKTEVLKADYKSQLSLHSKNIPNLADVNKDVILGHKGILGG